MAGIGTHIDISERKRSEQEIRSARDAAEAALQNLRETQNFPDRSRKTRSTWAAGGGLLAHEIKQSRRYQPDRGLCAGT